MAKVHFAVVVLALALVGAACADATAAGTEALSVQEYADTMAEIMDRPIPDDDYPIKGSTVQVTGIFGVVENGLSDVRALRAPEELTAVHDELVQQFEAVQQAVASYLQVHGMQGDDIELNHLFLDAEIGPLIAEARSGCADLREALSQLGVAFPAGTCLV